MDHGCLTYITIFSALNLRITVRTGKLDNLLFRSIDGTYEIVTLPNRAQVDHTCFFSNRDVQLNAGTVVNWSFFIHEGMSANRTLHSQ